jgi:DNA replication protein DnaC
MANTYDKVLTGIANAAYSARRISTNRSNLPLGTQQECPRCHELIEWRELGTPPRAIRYWSDCSCWLAACENAAAISHAAQDHASDYRAEPILSDVRAYQHFSLETFDASRLADGDKLLAIVTGWLAAIQTLPAATAYDTKPRACLFFYSGGKGRGKTHLAAAVALAARAAGKTVAIVDEISYVESYWAATLERKESLSALPAEKAWLTVFDDMGGRTSTTDGLRDCWYDLIGPRWLKRGWTIVTSNYTLDELAAKGTIDDRVYSRLFQMTGGGQIITFSGADQRLAGGPQ